MMTDRTSRRRSAALGRIILALGLAGALAACSDSAKEAFGLRKTPPDEFAATDAVREAQASPLVFARGVHYGDRLPVTGQIEVFRSTQPWHEDKQRSGDSVFRLHRV